MIFRKGIEVSFLLPETHFRRLEAAAEARGMSPEEFVTALVLWEAKAPDNQVQVLKDKIKAIANEETLSVAQALHRIEELVK